MESLGPLQELLTKLAVGEVRRARPKNFCPVEIGNFGNSD